MADRRRFSVSLVTPDGPAFEGEAEMIVVPGAAVDPRRARLQRRDQRRVPGEHADLAGGDVGDVLEFATGPGFFQVLEDRAIALVDDAVEASEVDDARAREQLDAAQKELDAIDRGESSADRWQVEQRLRHAENMLKGAGRG